MKVINIKFIIIKIFMFLIAFQFLTSISTSFIDTGLYNLISICILFILIFVYFIYKKKLMFNKKLIYIIPIFLIFAIYNINLSIVNTKKIFVTFSCFFCGFLFSKINNDIYTKKLLKTINYILLGTCIYGVVESLIGNFLDIYTVRVYAATYRIHSIFLHPIIFSLMMLIAFWLSYYLIENRILKFIFCMMSLYCIVMTLTRSAWVAFVITVILNIIKRKLNKGSLFNFGKKVSKWKLIELIIILIIIFIISTKFNLLSIVNRMSLRWGTLNNSMSVTYRSNAIYTLFASRLSDNNIIHWLIGSGYHGVQKAAANAGIYFGTVGNNVIDNQWISVFYDFGLIGIFVMIYIFVRSIIIFLKTKEIILKLMSLICFVCLFMGFFCDIFEWSTAANITFLFIGLISPKLNKNI